MPEPQTTPSTVDIQPEFFQTWGGLLKGLCKKMFFIKNAEVHIFTLGNRTSPKIHRGASEPRLKWWWCDSPKGGSDTSLAEDWMVHQGMIAVISPILMLSLETEASNCNWALHVLDLALLKPHCSKWKASQAFLFYRTVFIRPIYPMTFSLEILEMKASRASTCCGSHRSIPKPAPPRCRITKTQNA